MIDQQIIQFKVDLFFNRTRRKQQVGHNGADDTDDNLTASLNGELRRQHRLFMNSDNNDKRGIARQAPGIGVLNPHQRGDPGAESGPQAAYQHHQQRGADHQDDDRQRGDTADKGAGDTQHPAIADRPGVRLPACGKRRAGSNDGGGKHRPARRFQLKMKTDE